MPASFTPCDVSMAAEFGVWEGMVCAEARALFFLASWIDSGSRQPLHLACIGEPPASVQSLAARAGAHLRACARIPVNQLHALDAPLETGCVLLLGADSLVLRRIQADSPASAMLLLIPANKGPVPPPDWPAIYAAAGVTPPEARWPFYQSGSLWTEEPARLRKAWADQLTRVADERIALTVAAQALGAPGHLPEPWCARLAHWEAGTIAPSDTVVFQAAGLFQGLWDVSEIPTRLEVYGARLEAAVQSGFSSQGWWARRRAARGAKAVRRQLARLFRRYVAPALRESGAFV